jgi:hypothetical protein
MNDRRRKIIFITGWGRSGSTLLANILGQIPGFFSVGEIRAVWEYGMLQNGICGCGAPFLQCAFWNRVRAEFVSRRGGIRAEHWNALNRMETRTRNAWKFVLFPSRNPSGSPGQSEYLSVLADVYESVYTVSGCRVLVDSSKNPLYRELLRFLPGFAVYPIQLVRNPKAVAFSWATPKPRPGKPMRTIGPVQSSLMWDAWNGLTEWFRRTRREKILRVRYEDFLARPRKTIEEILAFCGEEPVPLPFLEDDSVTLAVNHTVRGNPDRFRTGRIDLREDIRWTAGLNRLTKILVDLLTWPLAAAYGYFGREGGTRGS